MELGLLFMAVHRLRERCNRYLPGNAPGSGMTGPRSFRGYSRGGGGNLANILATALSSFLVSLSGLSES